MSAPQHHPATTKQRGAALLVMLVIVVIGIAAALVGSLSSTVLKTARQETTAAALAQAKDALIGYAVTYGDSHSSSYGYLPCPDTNNDGSSDTNQGSTYCAGKDIPVVGRLPWKSLGLPPLRDGYGECLWYAVSGTFKAVAGSGNMNEVMNWDTLGQFTIQNTNGTILAGTTAYKRPVAVIFSAGPPLNAQSHQPSNGQECSGDASNDIAAYLESGNAFSPPRSPPATPLALTAGNSHSASNNDIALWITSGGIFNRIKKRSDFAIQIAHLLDDSDFRLQVETGDSEHPGIAISGTKGTDNINCDAITNTANQTFCNNWKEMLLLTQLSTSSPITIDGTPTAACTRVLIFGGEKTTTQSRQTDTDKNEPANYLEEPNLTAFAVPTTTSSNFSGSSTFNTSLPSTDLLRCLP